VATRRIIIIGGGIAGPALALFLKRIGLPAAVYEAYPLTTGVGGGLNIAPNGMQVLAALGLAGRMIEQGSQVPVSYFVDCKGKPLGKVPYGVKSLYGQPAVSLSRSALIEALADGMRAQGVEIHYEKRLIRITEQDEMITAHFEDGTSAGGDYLIGADGLHSLVREHILPEGPSRLRSAPG
jgi:2-polyprenyl-6-methoxyphenol hydroxylase-like FAD-dependent oxidoreductase